MAEMSEAVVAFFKAMGDSKSKEEIAAAAKEALRVVGEELVQIRKDAESIRYVAARFGGVSLSDLADAEADGGLSEDQKTAINRLIDQTLVGQPDISVEGMTELVQTQMAIQLVDFVDKPTAVIGSMLGKGRRRLEKTATATPTTPAQPAAAIPQPAQTAPVTPQPQPAVPAGTAAA